MYLQYGTYQHAPGEANLIGFQIRPRRSSRGFQLANTVQANVQGEFCLQAGETQYNLSAKIQDLMDALSRDGFDFGLYHDNGTPTPHVMYSGDAFNLTGNQVVYQSFPANHNGEYSTGRDFAYAIQAEYRASESLILEYSETMSHHGNTGPRIHWKENKYHPPTFNVSAFSSVQQIVQQGYAVTLGTWLIPPPPILPLPFYIPTSTVITRSTPKRYPQGVEGFRISWSYLYNSPVVVPAFPTIR